MWIKRFLEQVQNSDERVKRRWLVAFSIAAMAVILATWVFFSSSIFRATAVESTVAQPDEPGFWQIFKNGTGIIFDSISENFKDLISQITNKKTITIQ